MFWSKQTEVFKLGWGLGSKAIAALLGFAVVTKTGLIALDAIVGIFATGIPLLVISAQRSFSKYPMRLRKLITRYSVQATLCAVTALGMSFFVAVNYLLINQLFADSTNSIMQAVRFPVSDTAGLSNLPGIAGITKALAVFQCVILVIAVVAAMVSSFRNLQMEELISNGPKRGLFKYLVRRDLRATDLMSFAGFELTVIMASAMFSSGVVLTAHFVQLGM